jgi:hypothetical protein
MRLLKKTTLALFTLCTVVLFTIFCTANVSAATLGSGKCGDTLTWTLTDDGKIVIDGSGDMYDYFYDETPWYSYNYKIKTVVIGDNVTSIGNEAFSRCGNIRRLTIGKSVTSIGQEAFYMCDIRELVIPDSVKNIGKKAFYFNQELQSLDLGKGVVTIKDHAFSSCDSLESLVIPDSVTTIGDSAFSFCENITTITIGKNVSALESMTFYRCDALKSFTVLSRNLDFTSWENRFSTPIPTSCIIYGYNNSTAQSIAVKKGYTFSVLENINPEPLSGTCGNNLTWTLTDKGVLTIDGTGPMYDFPEEGAPWYEDRFSITSVVIGNKVTYIGNQAFAQCANMKQLTIGSGVKTIGANAFYLCIGLESITIPDNVTTLKETAFLGCTGATEIKLGNGLVTIGDSAFQGCFALESIRIPNSVITIGNGAFYNCKELSSVYIGKNVKTIGILAFWECVNLYTIVVYSPDVDLKLDDLTYSIFPVPVTLQKITLKGYKGSTAEAFAQRESFNYNFVELEEPAQRTGDIDGNDTIDIADVMLLFQHSMLPDLFPLSYTGSIDFTKDGTVDIGDALLLFQHSMLPGLFPIE